MSLSIQVAPNQLPDATGVVEPDRAALFGADRDPQVVGVGAGVADTVESDVGGDMSGPVGDGDHRAAAADPEPVCPCRRRGGGEIFGVGGPQQTVVGLVQVVQRLGDGVAPGFFDDLVERDERDRDRSATPSVLLLSSGPSPRGVGLVPPAASPAAAVGDERRRDVQLQTARPSGRGDPMPDPGHQVLAVEHPFVAAAQLTLVTRRGPGELGGRHQIQRFVWRWRRPTGRLRPGGSCAGCGAAGAG